MRGVTTALSAVYPKKRMKSFWFANPTQLLIQGQWCCTLCQSQWKPPRAHHCKTCHRCIFRMDHHCPWINNCVGLANQKLFILFLGYTALSAVVTLLMLSTSGICWLWGQKSWSD